MVNTRVSCTSLFIMVLIMNIQLAYSGKCNSFKNVMVGLRDIDGNEFNKTVNGCLERVEFDDKTIVKAFIRRQKLPVLGRDSVRNLVQLDTISFWGCELDVVEPFAFRNVPRLKQVQISYCNLKEIPKDVFNSIPNMELLRFHNNQIDFIENRAFSNLTSLKKVFGSDNNLEYWNREWFDDTTNMEVMDFQSNKIRTIPRRAFAAMGKLKQIFFDANEISAIQPEAFKGLTNLEYLGLRDNRLKVINEDIFPNKIKVRTLLLGNNYLNFLSNEVLQKISAKEITLHHNPWKCPCLDRVNYWLYINNGTLMKDDTCNLSFIPICAYSKTYSQSCLEYVDDELTQRYIENVRISITPKLKQCIWLD